MTTSLGQALPGLVSTRTPSRSAPTGGKDDASSFDHIVRAAETPGAEKQGPAEAGPQPARWTKTAASVLAKAEPGHDEQAKTSLPKPSAGKLAKGDADSDADEASADSTLDDQAASTAPLQDRLPLLMALHDIRNFSAAAKAEERSAATGGQTADAATDGQPLSAQQSLSLLKKSRSPSGANMPESGSVSRSERATNTPSLPGQLRQPETIGSLSKDLSGQDDGAMTLPKDQASTDPLAPPTKRAGPASKAIDAIKSATSSDQARQGSSAPRTEIVAEQSFPAPAQNPISQTTSTLIDAIAGDNSLRQAFSTPAAGAQAAGSVAVPTHILKIELHPAELGMVTASLRLSGEQLSIELKPETHEAYRRLAADSEAIVKSLRGLGFDVDKVAILQPSIAVPAAIRTDASTSLPTAPGRDQPSFQSGSSSGDSAGSGGQQPGRNNSNDTQDLGRAASPARGRAGDGMFI